MNLTQQQMPDAAAHRQQCQASLDAFLNDLESRPEFRGGRWIWEALLRIALDRIYGREGRA